MHVYVIHTYLQIIVFKSDENIYYIIYEMHVFQFNIYCTPYIILTRIPIDFKGNK